jgi:hypothetical protein
MRLNFPLRCTRLRSGCDRYKDGSAIAVFRLVGLLLLASGKFIFMILAWRARSVALIADRNYQVCLSSGTISINQPAGAFRAMVVKRA